MIINELAKSKNYVVNSYYLKFLQKFKLSVNELILFIYFINTDNLSLVPSKITRETGLSKNDILTAFNELINKGLMVISANKNDEGKIVEEISLDSFYKMVSDSLIDTNDKTDNQKKLRSELENITGEKISEKDSLIIYSWLDMGYSITTIVDAFKEAKYNGIVNLRYIDKVLSEWNERGIKNTEEANKYIKENSNKKNINLFDYDWLNEE